MTKAGFEPAQAFSKIAQDQSRPREIRGFATRVSQILNAGKSWGEALRFFPELPELDKALILGGAAAGRLESHFNLLGQTYLFSARLQESIVKQLAYPILLIHVGILAFPSAQLALCFNHGVLTFLKLKIFPLFLLWIIILLPFWLWRQRNFLSLRQASESFLEKLPFLGKAMRMASTARFCLALEGLVAAGFTPDKSWPLAARASGSQSLVNQVSQMIPYLRMGKSLREIFAAQGSSRATYLQVGTLDQIGTAELSGDMDTTLRRLYKDFSDNAEAQFKLLTEWIPRLIYFLALAYSGFSIVQSFSETAHVLQNQMDQVIDISK